MSKGLRKFSGFLLFMIIMICSGYTVGKDFALRDNRIAAAKANS